MPHLSRRGYARSRNLSEAAVRRHIASGVLADALTPDGLLDADRADELLRGSVTRKPQAKVPAVLRTARQRHLRAKVRRLLDEVTELKGSLIDPKHAREIIAIADRPVVECYRRLLDAAPIVAGKPAAEVHRALAKAANDCFVWYQDIAEAWYEAHMPKFEAEPEPDLDSLSPVELAALHENLGAEILELGRYGSQGLARRVDDVIAENEERMVVAKGLFLAIPGRVAQLVAISTVEEARELLSREVELVIAALEVPTDV